VVNLICRAGLMQAVIVTKTLFGVEITYLNPKTPWLDPQL
jgi:hypothetical protein